MLIDIYNDAIILFMYNRLMRYQYTTKEHAEFAAFAKANDMTFPNLDCYYGAIAQYFKD